MSRLEAALAQLAEAIREEVAEAAEQASRGPDRLLSVEEAAQAAGIGRTMMYDLIAHGQVRSVRLGRRRVVPASAIAELAQSPPDAT